MKCRYRPRNFELKPTDRSVATSYLSYVGNVAGKTFLRLDSVGLALTVTGSKVRPCFECRDRHDHNCATGRVVSMVLIA